MGSGLNARVAYAPVGEAKVCVVAIGKLVGAAVKAAETLTAAGIPTKVWDARSCAPLDQAMIADAAQHDAVITVEDGIREGGIGMSIEDAIASTRGAKTRVQVLGVPTQFIAHNKPDRILAALGLDAEGIAKAARTLIA